MTESTRIVVVGAGFAGTTLARVLARRLPAGASLTLLSDESYTTFNPMLPEAVGASIFPEHVIVPVRVMLRPDSRCRFVMGSVAEIDLPRRRLACRTLAGEIPVDYDHLVLAVGNRARLDLLPGMAEHGLPLKTVGDAMHIRNTVLRCLARIELESDPASRRRLGHFIVVGGGFSGVEVAGELVDCLRSIRRYYPRVATDELRVTVLHATERLLPELSTRLGRVALDSLRARGVDVRLGVRAVAVDADGVLLDGPAADAAAVPAGGRPGAGAGAGAARRERIEGATVIGTVGTAPNPLVAPLGLPTQGGRITVLPDLQVPAHDGLWALGDCAAVPNAHDGRLSPPTAQFAVRQARTLADNLCARLGGRSTRPFAHRNAGMMASIGHLKGVAEIGGVALGGLPAWLVWRAYYLSQMPSAGRRLRIFLEWAWGMAFPPDITHLRFTRSHQLLADEARRRAEHARADRAPVPGPPPGEDEPAEAAPQAVV